MKLRPGFKKEEFHFQVYYLSLCMLVISMPTSRFMITISLILLGMNWMAGGNFREKFRLFWKNKPALAFSSIYFIHVIGIFWTRDFNFALQNDLLHKLPTLFMPLIFVTSPLPDSKRIRLLLFLFIASVVTASLIGWILSMTREFNDFREISPFIPNIYFSMMLIIAAFHLPALIRQISENRLWILIGWIVSAWLVFFLFYSRSLSGIASLTGVLSFSVVLFMVQHKNTFFKAITGVLFLAFIALGIWMLTDMYNKTHAEIKTNFNSLETHTLHGYPYSHDTLNILRENGHLVYLYIAEGELEESWNQRSDLNFQEKDKLNHELKYTLYRYMASKGLRKDRKGMDSFTENDIKSVEQGVTNFHYLEWPGFYVRLHQMMSGLYVYRKTGYAIPTWSTLTERIDLWRASIVAFGKYPVFGWGTGSITQAMEYGKQKNKSALIGRNMKPHSQYFYTLLSMGLFGLVSSFLLFSYFVMKSGVYKFFYFWILILVFGINFIGNNSIESQLGQNLFVFFALYYSYFYPQIKIKQNSVY